MTTATTLKRPLTPEQRRRKQAYERMYYSPPSGVRKQDTRLVVPDDIERRPTPYPCAYCGTARACKHRPWA